MSSSYHFSLAHGLEISAGPSYEGALRMPAAATAPELSTIDPRLIFGNQGASTSNGDAAISVSSTTTSTRTSTDEESARGGSSGHTAGVQVRAPSPVRRSKRIADRLACQPAVSGTQPAAAVPVRRKQGATTRAKKAQTVRRAPATSAGTRAKKARRVKENQALSRPRKTQRIWHCEVCDVGVLDEARARERHEGSNAHLSKLGQSGLPLPERHELRCGVCDRVFVSNRTDSLTRHQRLMGH
ncbi:hypothetical protein DAEQUDRAFT_765116 [Daedalea quercina L-15889]|uniref:Uncharacterized protein n=1 Tax=Daedalea quercina L-15889 TaxID=1314783 RepID=A0A165QQI9_9APHY|nr:hypothetical protein DAEQUDRAFT_765116 [Daedalea quercina L-15889]